MGNSSVALVDGAATAPSLPQKVIGWRRHSASDCDPVPSSREEASTVPRPDEIGSPIERRSSAKRRVSQVPSITGLRLSPCGGEASLVNISTSGVLVKINVRLLPGTVVTVVFDGTFSPSSVKSRVARCLVADIDSSGVIWYNVGIAFNEPIALGDMSVGTHVQPEPVQPIQTEAVPVVLTNRW